MFRDPILNPAVILLSLRVPAPFIAVGVLIYVLPWTLFLLGFGFIARRACLWFLGEQTEPAGRAWRFFKWGVLSSGGVAWLVLTIVAINTPTGRTNESAAVANLRTINTAEVTYLDGHHSYGDISALIAARLLDSRFEGPVSGYIFSVTPSMRDYTATAFPVSTKTGKYGYYTAGDAVIRYARSVPETCKPCYPEGMSGEPVQ